MRTLLGRRDDHLRCRQVRKLVQSYLDGELPAPDADKVAEIFTVDAIVRFMERKLAARA